MGRLESVPISNLLAVQYSVFPGIVDRYENDLLSGIEFDAAPLLPYPASASQEFLLLDNHHRTAASYRVGRQTIAGEILTDSEVVAHLAVRRERYAAQGFIFWPRAYTADDVRRTYEEIVLPTLKEFGAVGGVDTLQFYPPHTDPDAQARNRIGYGIESLVR